MSAAGKSVDAEQEVEAERRAEELREVGRHGDELRLDPQPDRDAVRELLAADLGRLRPVAIPSFAESVWISIAIRFAATITQTSV